MQRAQLIRKLVLDSQYVIDEHVIARAILTRAALRGMIADARFRNDPPAPRVRSFRPSPHARSFRPCTIGTSPRGRGSYLHLGLI